MNISELHQNDIAPSTPMVSVTRPARAPDFAWKIGSGFDVFYNKGNYPLVRVFDNKSIVAKVSFKTDSAILPGVVPVLVVGTARVKSTYQGQGLGLELYKNLITKQDWVLGGYDHSVGAKKLWVKLSEDPEIQVYVYTESSDGSPGAWNIPSIKGAELSLSTRYIYDSYSDYLVAVHKNSAVDRYIQKQSETPLKSLMKKTQNLPNAQ